jgi:opioid growth factor receptor-like protein
MTNDIYEFLEGKGTDHRSRRIEDILAFDDGDLEAVHDYIQWLFPLPESSAFTPFAPILSSQDIAELKASSIVRRNLLAAASRMLGFYQKNTHWLTAINHNHLRITRIIRSLAILVGPDKAQWFHSEIEKLVTAAGGPVGQEALDYWRGALQAGAIRAPRTTTD